MRPADNTRLPAARTRQSTTTTLQSFVDGHGTHAVSSPDFTSETYMYCNITSFRLARTTYLAALSAA